MDEPYSMARSPVTIFYSYAHEDEAFRQQLENHLSLLRHQGIISDWHDRQIGPGRDWSQEIDNNLNSAQIILLLISADFLASDYCYGIEMRRALERHESQEALVIPILLRPVDWQNAPFAKLKVLPKNGKPITKWPTYDDAFAEIVKDIRTSIKRISGKAPQKSEREISPISRNLRQRLLKLVRTYWISGFLEQSLFRSILLELGLHNLPDAIPNPWQLTVQEINQLPHTLQKDIRITQVYDEADGELLILGEPGSGKTTLLLELARSLLDRAEADESHPIPVVFNLSTWGKKQQSLVGWLVEELHQRYQISRKLGQSWLASHQLILLLDGLDEVDPAVRSKCVTAINTFRRQQPLVAVTVCSRSSEYFALETQVQLLRAVMVQPLTMAQIEDYISSAVGQLEAVRALLHDDLWFQEMASTPLMLRILTLAYHGKSIEELPAASAPNTQQFQKAVDDLRKVFNELLDANPSSQESQKALTDLERVSENLLLLGRFAARRRQLFAAYIQRMLTRRGVDKRYSLEQTIHWLSLIAKQLVQRNQIVFKVGDIKSTWFSDARSHWVYRIITGLIVGLFLEPV